MNEDLQMYSKPTSNDFSDNLKNTFHKAIGQNWSTLTILGIKEIKVWLYASLIVSVEI